MDRDDAVYQAYIEVVPYTSNEVEVEVEDGEDEFGEFVRVHYENNISSKIRYEI